jgi:peptidoglycan-associated lipoprotein
MQRLFAASAAIILLSACSSDPAKTAADTPLVIAKPAPRVAPLAAAAPAETEARRLERLKKILSDKSIYFAYDDYSLKPEYQSLLKQDADLLTSAPTPSVTLTGNADERGSSEYNLALGQKRAEAVKQALSLFGVPAARLEAVSYGKEKPRAACHEEKCWAENRRVDLATSKP